MKYVYKFVAIFMICMVSITALPLVGSISYADAEPTEPSGLYVRITKKNPKTFKEKNEYTVTIKNKTKKKMVLYRYDVACWAYNIKDGKSYTCKCTLYSGKTKIAEGSKRKKSLSIKPGKKKTLKIKFTNKNYRKTSDYELWCQLMTKNYTKGGSHCIIERRVATKASAKSKLLVLNSKYGKIDTSTEYQKSGISISPTYAYYDVVSGNSNLDVYTNHDGIELYNVGGNSYSTNLVVKYGNKKTYKIRLDVPKEKGYLESELSSRTIDMDEIYNSISHSTPFLQDKMTPQGLCYMDNYAVVTLYGEKTAVVVLVDIATGTATKVIHLKNEVFEQTDMLAHVGGVAYDGDSLWISGGDACKVLRITGDKIKKIIDDEDVLYDAKLNEDYEVFYTKIGDSTFKNPSFLTCKDGYLYVGGFSKNYSNSLAAFQITSDGLVYTASKNIIIPYSIQGATFDCEENLYLSGSYGRTNDSRLYKMTIKNNKYYVTSVYYLPCMSEGIAIDDGYMHILFESSSAKYRNSANSVQDYIWAVEESTL